MGRCVAVSPEALLVDDLADCEPEGGFEALGLLACWGAGCRCWGVRTSRSSLSGEAMVCWLVSVRMGFAWVRRGALSERDGGGVKWGGLGGCLFGSFRGGVNITGRSGFSHLIF